MIKPVFNLICIMCSLSPVLANPRPITPELTQKIDDWLNRSVEKGLSGAVLVARGGEVVLSKGYGWANKEAKIANSSDTVFPIGSNTKQFTAVAILKLVQQKKINLTDNLQTFFADVPGDKKEITVHQLLSHRAGFKTYSGSDFDPISLDQYLKDVFASEPVGAPGETYHYSNVGYSLLAIILEKVSGMAYEDFLNQYLFQPADMHHTGYLRPNWNANNLAHGYQGTILPIGTLIERFKDIGVTWHLKGNGGIHSNLKDLHKWRQALKTDKILPDQLKQKLFVPYAFPGKKANKGYAYGWALRKNDRDARVVFHNGANPFYFSEIIWSLDEDIEVVFLTNARTDEAEQVAWQIQKAIFKPNHQLNVGVSPYFLIWQFISDHSVAHMDGLRKLINKEIGDIEDRSLLNRIGLWQSRQDKHEWAVALLKMNAGFFPDDGNLMDSLGEAYLAAGNQDDAVKSFQKALDLAPAKGCHWCENAQTQLNKIKQSN